MSRKKKSEAPVSFQITPMIDMTFLLLVFFMVTSILTEQKVKKDINLPDSTAAVIPDDLSRRDIINIDQNGDFFIDNDAVTDAQLREFLESRNLYYTPRDPSVKPYLVYLRADKDTPYSRVAEFIELGTDVGVDRVIFGVLND